MGKPRSILPFHLGAFVLLRRVGLGLRFLRFHTFGGLSHLGHLGGAFLWPYEDGHALTFEHGHLLHLAKLLQIVGETQQEHFALFLEKYAATAEEDVSLQLVALREEAFGMLELEVVVVVVGLRSEAYFLHFHLYLFGLHLFLALLLLVEEFRIGD